MRRVSDQRVARQPGMDKPFHQGCLDAVKETEIHLA
jgi:hypothetical protein